MNHSPKILAHRGSVSEFAPENTLAAIQGAIDCDVFQIETDVRATIDGVAVLMHDADFQRIANRDSKISSITYEQAKDIRLAGNQHIISLADALNWFPNASFNIDVKSKDAISPTARAINETKSWDRVLIASFSDSRRKKTLALLSNPVKTSPGAVMAAFILIASKLPNTRCFGRLVRGFHALQVPVQYGPIRFDSAKLISKLHRFGVEVHFWVIDDVNEAVRLTQLGADALVTDELKILKATLS